MDGLRLVVVGDNWRAQLIADVVAKHGAHVEIVDARSILVQPTAKPAHQVIALEIPSPDQRTNKTHGQKKVGRKGKVKRW